jgi:hypothetical protein
MSARPTFVVCEDGSEYIDRFRRFLGDDVDFVAAQDCGQAHALVAGAAGLLLDLDFRRTPPEKLVDERGPASRPLDAGTRARLAETQGILILRQLRAAGVVCPAVLFADIDDVGQRRYLEQTLAPLTIAGSHLGLTEIAALLRICALGG